MSNLVLLLRHNQIERVTASLGLMLSYVDDDTIAVSAGTAVFNDGNTYRSLVSQNITFANLDTGARTLGRDYAVFATPAGIKLTLINVNHPTGLIPGSYSVNQVALLGYFHNGPKADGTVGPARNQAILKYSITNNALLDMNYPYRAHNDLPAGVPLPGMAKIGSVAIGLYQASREDATALAVGASAYPTSRYGVVPWSSIAGWDMIAACRNAGCRLPSWEEWLGAVEWNPGASAPARCNGNTAYGSASDDACLLAPIACTAALAGLGAGNVNTGTHSYKVTLVNAIGETNGSSASNAVTTTAGDGQVNLTAIPLGTAGTTARKIYRTVAGGATYKFLTTIADNVTTIYTDNIADAALGANEPSWNTTGAQQGVPDPTLGGRTLTGTGPRTTLNAAVAAGRSWYSPTGLADAVGNIWECMATFFGGLKTSSPDSGVAWGHEQDYAYNFLGQAYNPDTGGYTEGLPAVLFVGGYCYLGSSAGVRTANTGSSPGNLATIVGFRLAR